MFLFSCQPRAASSLAVCVVNADLNEKAKKPNVCFAYVND
jgi:hypothetical protein